MEALIVVTSAPLENLKNQFRDRLSWEKKVYAIADIWKLLDGTLSINPVSTQVFLFSF